VTPRYRLGVDIGGTFTDAILINELTGEIRVGKVPSTPLDPSQGFMEATHRMLREADLAPDEVRFVVHGTTIATNTIIEGKVARAGFITTDGFRDLLEIQRQIRPTLYDLQFEKPQPLVPRHLLWYPGAARRTRKDTHPTRWERSEASGRATSTGRRRSHCGLFASRLRQPDS
jgi:N-methylhydantoinase A/oxoprolinase/acetone carboxylase beta subunit